MDLVNYTTPHKSSNNCKLKFCSKNYKEISQNNTAEVQCKLHKKCLFPADYIYVKSALSWFTGSGVNKQPFCVVVHVLVDKLCLLLTFWLNFQITISLSLSLSLYHTLTHTLYKNEKIRHRGYWQGREGFH